MDQWALDLALLLRGAYGDLEGRRILCRLLRCTATHLWLMENRKRRPGPETRRTLRELAVMDEHEHS